VHKKEEYLNQVELHEVNYHPPVEVEVT